MTEVQSVIKIKNYFVIAEFLFNSIAYEVTPAE